MLLFCYEYRQEQAIIPYWFLIHKDSKICMAVISPGEGGGPLVTPRPHSGRTFRPDPQSPSSMIPDIQFISTFLLTCTMFLPKESRESRGIGEGVLF